MARRSRTRTSSGTRTGRTAPATAAAAARPQFPERSAAMPCPCGLDGRSYGDCCGAYHASDGTPGSAAAATAERLMRSRYSAFALGDVEYLLRSWHSTTRPTRLDLDPAQRWLRLEVLGATEGGPFHVGGTVAFRAHWSERGRDGVVEENSRFVREGGAWVYLDAL